MDVFNYRYISGSNVFTNLLKLGLFLPLQASIYVVNTTIFKYLHNVFYYIVKSISPRIVDRGMHRVYVRQKCSEISIKLIFSI